MLHQTPDQITREAFNLGCDARIAGRGVWDNPYRTNHELRLLWSQGWKHADHFWGIQNPAAPALPDPMSKAR